MMFRPKRQHSANSSDYAAYNHTLIPPGQCAVYEGHLGESLCCKDSQGIFHCNKIKWSGQHVPGFMRQQRPHRIAQDQVNRDDEIWLEATTGDPPVGARAWVVWHGGTSGVLFRVGQPPTKVEISQSMRPRFGGNIKLVRIN